MSRQIIWSPTSEGEFSDILDYLHRKWGNKVANQFIDKLDQSIRLISFNPELFPLTNGELGIRKCVITKHNTLFYRYSENKIEIIRIFDSRQNPDSLTFKAE